MNNEPKSDELWISRSGNSTRYLIVTVAIHTTRFSGEQAQRLVIFHAAYGQDADPRKVLATPIDDFLAAFRSVEANAGA